jgi:hypothetical protein
VSERNALARSLKRLPAIAALETLWARREADGESEEDYWAFLTWLDGGSTRGSPPAKHSALAARFEWAERALAYERVAELQDAGNAPGATPEQQIVANLITMVQIETKKLVEQCAKDPGSVVTVKDMVATVGLISNLQKQAIQAESAKTDLSKLTEQELRDYLRLQKRMREIAGVGS